MSKERLEEIKNGTYLYFRKHNELKEDMDWLIEQARRVQELEQDVREWEIKLLRNKLAQSIEPRESEFHFLKDSTSYRLHEIVARVGKWLVVRLYRVEDEDVVTHMSIIRSQYPEQEHERGYGIIDPVTLERPTWAPEFMTIDEALELLKKNNNEINHQRATKLQKAINYLKAKSQGK